jgi:AcrR family transcriptional regulator
MAAARSRRPKTNAEWSTATIQELTRRARKEFARAGYAASSLDKIAEDAHVTKGAVYYHFKSKEGLFEAVLRDVQREIVERIDARAARTQDPCEAIVAGCQAFLDVALDDELRQITLIDGPSVLGWSKWRAIDAEFGLGSLREGLAACARAGLLRSQDPRVLAHLLSGALNEAVFMVAEAEDRDAAYASVARQMRAFVRRALA